MNLGQHHRQIKIKGDYKRLRRHKFDPIKTHTNVGIRPLGLAGITNGQTTTKAVQNQL